MASFSLLSPTIYIHDTDLTSYCNRLSLKASADELDTTAFGATYHSRIGGLKTAGFDFDGFWESTPDLANFSTLGTPGQVATVSPAGTEAATAYFLQTGRFAYEEFGKIGTVTPFMVSTKNTGANGLIRGQLAKVKGTVSATGQLGSICTITGPTAAQFLYASLNIFVAATTITVTVESAATIGFAGPTLRATFGPLTVAGGTFLTRVAGPFTDGFWRFNVTVVTGTFTVAGAIGVGS